MTEASELLDPTEAAGKAVWAGIGALACAAVGPFCCYITSLPGFGLGVWAAWTAWQGLEIVGRGAEDRATRSALNAGLFSGLMAAALSGFLLMIFALVVVFYLVMFAIMGASALSA